MCFFNIGKHAKKLHGDMKVMQPDTIDIETIWPLVSRILGVQVWSAGPSPTKEIYAVIPRTNWCVTLHGNRDFADMIKVKELKMRSLSWIYVSGLDLSTINQSVQSLIRVWLYVTPWTAAHQTSLSITNSQGLLKPMSIKSVMPSNHLILCHPLLLLPSIFPSIRVFSSESVLCIRWPDLELHVQHQPFQWIFRTDFP